MPSITGKESYSALQICEMALAAVNAGVYAMALWTFVDVPNPVICSTV